MPMLPRIIHAVALFAINAPFPAHSQTGETSGQATVGRDSPTSEDLSQTPLPDIIVDGMVEPTHDKPAVSDATFGSERAGSAVGSRTLWSLSERFARCSIKWGMSDTAPLRSAIDGAINGAKQRFWQERFIGLHSTCAQDPALAREIGVASFGDSHDPIYYDRGAMIVRSLNIFAPNLSLTKQQTSDPAVQARFNIRETPLARYRLPVDRQYFEMAVCFVRLKPELAVRLISLTEDNDIKKTEAKIVNGTPICTGGARNVYFDAVQFRMYIADAVYRWAVAAKSVNSLIPIQ